MFYRLIGWSSALCLSGVLLQAQETNEVEQLKLQLRQMQQQIEALTRRLDELTKGESVSPVLPAVTAEQKALEKQLAEDLAKETAEHSVSTSGPSATNQQKPWSASQPITVARSGSAYMNIGFDAMMVAGWSSASDPSQQLQLGDHEPRKRGFSLPNTEIALEGAVDPYFKGFANLLFKLDQDNETEVELEEAYLQSISLPANLQVKGGQFLAPFGRHNTQHPHAWSFVDTPIILSRALGPEGLRNPGAQISWLAPTPFYTELFLGIFDGQGGTMHSFRNPGEDDGAGTDRFAGRATLDRRLRGAQDLVFTPRLATSFDLTGQQTLVAGLSGAFGPNSTGPHSRTEIYGADLYWKWKPANARRGFPFVSWQTEALYRRFGAGEDLLAPIPLSAENIRDWGFYSQVLWGFQPRWVAGLRGEFADGNTAAYDAEDPFRGERWRLSPSLTFYPSEFSKLRLQYNYDQGESFGSESSFWLQMEFMLGAHAAHTF